MVGEVVATGDENGAADNVADSDGEEVVEEEVGNGGSGEIIDCAGDDAGRNIKHIGDRMFKTAKDEEHNWEEDSGDFASNGSSGGSHPDSDTDEKVA